MIIRFHPGTSEHSVLSTGRLLDHAGVRWIRSPEPRRPILAALDKVPADVATAVASAEGVQDTVRVAKAWRQVAREFLDAPSVARVGPYHIGPGHPPLIMAGPCSVEGSDAVRRNALEVRAAGAHVLRGGAYKPRTSPYSFQGFGIEGLRQLKEAGDAAGMPVVSEIMDAAHLPHFLDAGIDCLQLGARNMQNFTLLKAVASAGLPVLLKRGLAATVEEWLLAAEYLMSGGCRDVLLCERGIRTYETATRNTLDLTVLPLVRQWTHLPIVVDPAHAAGIASIIGTLCRASVAAGADGLTVEVHLDPGSARSDGAQALLPGELKQVCAEARILRALF